VRNIVKVARITKDTKYVIDLDDLFLVDFSFVTEFKICVTQELG